MGGREEAGPERSGHLMMSRRNGRRMAIDWAPGE